MVQLPLVPARRWLAGASTPGCPWGSTWGHRQQKNKEKAWVPMAGCQAGQCRVPVRGFLPPDKVKCRVSQLPQAAAGLSPPGRRGRLAPLRPSSPGGGQAASAAAAVLLPADK